MPPAQTTPDDPDPQFDLTLEPVGDSASRLGLILITAAGKNDPKGIVRNKYPRQSTRIDTSGGTYDSMNPPYVSYDQQNWQGGRGFEDLDRDKSKYLDSMGLNTELENQVVLRGLTHLMKGDIKSFEQNMPSFSAAAVQWFDLYDGGSDAQYLADAFVADGAWNTGALYLNIKKTGTPGTLTVEVTADSGGDPDTVLTTGTLTAAAHQREDDVSVLHRFALSSGALSDGVTYHVKVYGADTDDSTNYWSVQVRDNTVTSSKSSSDGSTWSNNVHVIYFHLVDDTADFNGSFFEYKRAKYFILNWKTGTNADLYLNGDRGVADSNAGNLDRLIDATKSWPTNKWAGAIVLLVNGPASFEPKPWRTIVSNTATDLVVDSNWERVQGIQDEYIIVDTPYWTKLQDLGGVCSDVAVADKFVYFAYNQKNPIQRYRAYRDGSGVWQEELVDEPTAFVAKHLLAIRHPTDGHTLWISRDGGYQLGTGLHRARVPENWGNALQQGDLYNVLRELVPTDTPWDAWVVSNVTQSTNQGYTRIGVAAGHGTGVAAVENLAEPVDISDGVRLGMKIRVSNAGIVANDLQLIMDDELDLGREYVPDQLKLYLRYGQPDAIYFYDDSGAGETKYFPQSGGTLEFSWFEFQLTLASADYLYLGKANRFDTIGIELGSAVNNNAATMGIEFWDGKQWVSASGLSDGTASGGATLAQTGVVSFTLPETWNRGVDVSSTDASPNEHDELSLGLYWIRIQPSVLLDAVNFERINVDNQNDNTVEFIEQFIDMATANDGDSDDERPFTLTDADRIYVGHDRQFNEVTFDFGATVNAVSATLSMEYWNGYEWSALTISDGTASGGAPFAQDGDVTFTPPNDWIQNTVDGAVAYWIRFKVDATLTAEVRLTKLTVTRKNNTTINLPALTEDDWTWVEIDYTPLQWPLPDHTRIRSVGLNIAVDRGANNIDIDGGIQVLSENLPFIRVGDDEENINGLHAYGETRANPFVLKEASVWEIQTENGDIPVKVPIGEIAAMRSESNGLAHATNDVYLYFNLNHHLERFFNRTLDDIGPNRDAGLPDGRQGIVRAVYSMPGSILAVVDSDSGFSSILARRGGGWHEVFRGIKGEAIHSLTLVVTPGNKPNQLWFNMGDTLAWVPISAVSQNSLFDPNFPYTHEGYMVTGWIAANFLNVVKLYKSLQAFTEKLSTTLGSSVTIGLEYQIEGGNLDDNGWTAVSTSFTTSPFQEIDLSANYDVRARRLRYRLRFHTQRLTLTPVLKSIVSEILERFPQKRSFTITFLVSDDPQDLHGEPDNTTKAETTSDQIDTWADSPIALTLRNRYDPYDNAIVVIEEAGSRPFILKGEDAEGKPFEAHVAEATLLEI